MDFELLVPRRRAVDFGAPTIRSSFDFLLEGDGFELLVPRHESPRFPKHLDRIVAPTV